MSQNFPTKGKNCIQLSQTPLMQSFTIFRCRKSAPIQYRNAMALPPHIVVTDDNRDIPEHVAVIPASAVFESMVADGAE